MSTINLSDEQVDNLKMLLEYSGDHLEDLIRGEPESLAIGDWQELKKVIPDIRQALESPNPRRIKTTDNLGNVAYIHKRSKGWGCTLDNGIPAGMSYAIGYLKDETGLIFMLEDASSDEERLNVIKRASPGRVVELV